MNYTADRDSAEPLYLQLYRQLKNEITAGVFAEGSRLPSKRLIAEELGISVVSVEHALSLLCDEGFAEARQRSGYYVIYKESDGFSIEDEADAPRRHVQDAGHQKASARAASSDSAGNFPFSVFAKTMRKVISDRAEELLVRSPGEGIPQLRKAISSYLARNRGLNVSEEQIIIGSGAEYLYGMLVHILGIDLIYGIERPSYEKIEQIYVANDVHFERLALGPDGIKSSELKMTDADVLHISPYRSYPSGVTASASKRREYIRWADAKPGRYIIEDDFESEFTPSTKPDDTLFSLAGRQNVIYLNTFSKTVAPSIRAGYMVLPPPLLGLYKERAGFYSCAVPTFEQYVLAEFINNGDFERHINRVRRNNRKKLAEEKQARERTQQ